MRRIIKRLYQKIFKGHHWLSLGIHSDGYPDDSELLSQQTEQLLKAQHAKSLAAFHDDMVQMIKGLENEHEGDYTRSYAMGFNDCKRALMNKVQKKGVSDGRTDTNV